MRFKLIERRSLTEVTTIKICGNKLEGAGGSGTAPLTGQKKLRKFAKLSANVLRSGTIRRTEVDIMNRYEINTAEMESTDVFSDLFCIAPIREAVTDSVTTRLATPAQFPGLGFASCFGRQLVRRDTCGGRDRH